LVKEDKYLASLREIEVRLKKGGDLYADIGNMIAVLQKRFGYFWIGVYFCCKDRLVLGPFQGPPACVFLSLDGGVCAACVREEKSIIVPDVHAFAGHVACDPRSRSEIVIPLFDSRTGIRGVLDVDSDRPDAFDEIDRDCLEQWARLIQPLWKMS
jgi:L-methionine (R)-S-oxide reductase